MQRTISVFSSHSSNAGRELLRKGWAFRLRWPQNFGCWPGAELLRRCFRPSLRTLCCTSESCGKRMQRVSGQQPTKKQSPTVQWRRANGQWGFEKSGSTYSRTLGTTIGSESLTIVFGMGTSVTSSVKSPEMSMCARLRRHMPFIVSVARSSGV